MGEEINTKTLVLDKLLKTNMAYVLQVRDEEDNVLGSIDFICNNFCKINPSNTRLKVVGDRILRVSFKYPLQNLGESIKTSGKYALANIYAIYYGQTSTNTQMPHYAGAFHYFEGFRYIISKDLRSIEIISSEALPNGKHKLMINGNKDYFVNNKDFRLRDFGDPNTGDRLLPQCMMDFEVESKYEAAKLLRLKPLSRTSILAVFDKAVLMDEVNYFKNAVVKIVDTEFEEERELELDGVGVTIYLTKNGPTVLIGLDIPDTVVSFPYDEKYEMIVKNTTMSDYDSLVPANPIIRNALRFNELIFNLKPYFCNIIPGENYSISLKNIRDAYGSIIQIE